MRPTYYCMNMSRRPFVLKESGSKNKNVSINAERKLRTPTADRSCSFVELYKMLLG